MVETTAGVGQLLPCRECGRPCSVQTFDGQIVEATLWVCSGNPHLGGGCPSLTVYLTEDAWQTRSEQPRPTEIRDPILRLFIEEILRQAPNGEAIRVTYHPNGEWSVLPEATGKADAGHARTLNDAVVDITEAAIMCLDAGCEDDSAKLVAFEKAILPTLAALTTGADGVAAENEACAALAEAEARECRTGTIEHSVAWVIASQIRARMGEG